MELLGTLGKSLQIHDDEHEYASMEELFRNQKGSISKLHVFNNEARIDFLYTKQIGVTFVCPSNNSEEEALFLRTREFLYRRFNRWSYLLDVRVWGALLVLSVVIFLEKLYPPNFLPIWVVVPLLMIIFLVTPLRGLLLNLVTTNDHSERGLFWKTNKDKIFLAVISAVIGAIISWFAAKLK